MIRISTKTKEEPQPERLMVSAGEAARMLGVSPRMLWGLTREGKLPCVRAGRRVLYSYEALRRFANGESCGVESIEIRATEPEQKEGPLRVEIETGRVLIDGNEKHNQQEGLYHDRSR